jgi:hypothetical protein
MVMVEIPNLPHCVILLLLQTIQQLYEPLLLQWYSKHLVCAHCTCTDSNNQTMIPKLTKQHAQHHVISHNEMILCEIEKHVVRDRHPGVTVLGTFTLSYKTTPHGLQFFGDVKILIVLEAPVALFPQPTFAEQSYNQMQKGERDVLTKKKNHPGFSSSN